jgi:hypothetical protein
MNGHIRSNNQSINQSINTRFGRLQTSGQQLIRGLAMVIILRLSAGVLSNQSVSTTHLLQTTTTVAAVAAAARTTTRTTRTIRATATAEGDWYVHQLEQFYV